MLVILALNAVVAFASATDACTGSERCTDTDPGEISLLQRSRLSGAKKSSRSQAVATPRASHGHASSTVEDDTDLVDMCQGLYVTLPYCSGDTDTNVWLVDMSESMQTHEAVSNDDILRYQAVNRTVVQLLNSVFLQAGNLVLCGFAKSFSCCYPNWDCGNEWVDYSDQQNADAITSYYQQSFNASNFVSLTGTCSGGDSCASYDYATLGEKGQTCADVGCQPQTEIQSMITWFLSVYGLLGTIVDGKNYVFIGTDPQPIMSALLEGLKDMGMSDTQVGLSFFTDGVWSPSSVDASVQEALADLDDYASAFAANVMLFNYDVDASDYTTLMNEFSVPGYGTVTKYSSDASYDSVVCIAASSLLAACGQCLVTCDSQASSIGLWSGPAAYEGATKINPICGFSTNATGAYTYGWPGQKVVQGIRDASGTCVFACSTSYIGNVSNSDIVFPVPTDVITNSESYTTIDYSMFHVVREDVLAGTSCAYISSWTASPWYLAWLTGASAECSPCLSATDNYNDCLMSGDLCVDGASECFKVASGTYASCQASLDTYCPDLSSNSSYVSCMCTNNLTYGYGAYINSTSTDYSAFCQQSPCITPATPAPTTAGSGGCCFYPTTGDICADCSSWGSDDFCNDETNCGGCGGYWCDGSS
eukprot:TRINITY_DN11296_c0_g1_i1.p1 TRINITY_DN11296_c0_g1~~TRINITY_DN11296_c0_g1_i1.p1  ORF type:complete len:668 (-),score=61.93 TRINITY_DN11296_c0_g1_i1:268-2214(-)